MIYFFSGVPGSGKSLHAARMIDHWVKRGKNVIANFEINEKFWDNCKEKQGQIIEKNNDTLTIRYLMQFAMKNHERNSRGQIVEKQTLLVIDECQTMFNSRSWNQRGRAEWVILFSQHRKFGYEVILISQSKDLVDKQIRGQFEYNFEHRNVKNFKVFGRLLSLFFGGNFFVVIVKWMANNKKDHSEFLLNMKKYYKLYDSYKIFDEKLLCQLSDMPTRDGE